MFSIDDHKIYSVDECDDIIRNAKFNGRCKDNKQTYYQNIVCAFDIETTSFTDGDRIDNKRSIMYVWQFAIDGRVIMGRTWDEFMLLISKLEHILSLTIDNKLLIYCHNLNFEFTYLAPYFEWEKVFAVDSHKPIYALTTSGIEFRCSYILTNYSLAKLADQLQHFKVSKMVGDLDYSKMRHQYTPLTPEEIQYCINDVLVVSCYIQECIWQEKYICRIPLTATGYCRRYVRHECLYSGGKQGKRAQYDKYHAKMKALTIDGPDEYDQLKRAFQGGFTHANALYSSWMLTKIDSIDFTSSYPYCLLSEEYPMGKGKLVEIHSVEELNMYLEKYCCIFDIEFTDLEATFPHENYISESKCFTRVGLHCNNGRVYKGDIVGTTITNVDYEIIRKVYKFSQAKIYNFRIYQKGYLPIEIIRSIIHFYKAKTTLKGVKGKEQEYLTGKALLNAVYGMIVMDVVKDTYTFNNYEWGIDKADAEKEIKKYNNSRKRFLYYPWGVFCTAYARKNLWTGILEFGEDYVYSDTDSIKCRNIIDHFKFIFDYNCMCEYKLRKMCMHYGINYEEELLPKTIKGEVKPLGVWDWETEEHKYDYFKTIGAKRYMVYQNGELSLTVSGVNKKVAIPYLLDKYTIEECFEAFDFGLNIPAVATGKLTHYYIDKTYEGDITDYTGTTCHYKALSGVYLEPAEYSFDMAQEYIDYLKGYRYIKL